MEKGLIYNLHNKKKNWLVNLALEAETAIGSLPATDREYYRKKVSDHIEKLRHQNKSFPYHISYTESKIVKSIQTKLKDNDAIITSTDKGNSMVILPTHQYHMKIQNFVDKNKFQISTTNPTKTFQNQIRNTIDSSTKLINPDSRWKFINLNPSAPTIRGLVKLHKVDQPIRPVVNWRNAPAYKLSKLLAGKIKQFTSLPYTLNIKNSTELIRELKHTPLTPTSKFASLDITTLYSNIPIKEKKQILENILTHNPIDPQIKLEILNWYEIIIKQNYFLNNNEIIIQKDGFAMGAPSTSILSEIFLQNIEHTHLPGLAEKHKPVNYFRFVDDILIIYDSQHTIINAILSDFNSIHPKKQYTEETEQNNTIDYLDITIQKNSQT